MAVLRSAIPLSFLRPHVALSRRTARYLDAASSSVYRRALATATGAAIEPSSLFQSLDTFPDRHIGPNDEEVQHMLSKLGYDSLNAFVAATVPEHIRINSSAMDNTTIPALTESELLRRAKDVADTNQPFRSYIGMGYHNAVVPSVILRNVRAYHFRVH